MQNSKRIQRILKKLDSLEDVVSYYTNDNDEYRKDFAEIREAIDELGLDRKKDHARFARHLKGLWNMSDKE